MFRLLDITLRHSVTGRYELCHTVRMLLDALLSMRQLTRISRSRLVATMRGSGRLISLIATCTRCSGRYMTSRQGRRCAVIIRKSGHAIAAVVIPMHQRAAACVCRVANVLQGSTCWPLRLSRNAQISPVPPRPRRPMYSCVSLSPGSRWLCCMGAMLLCFPLRRLPLRRLPDTLPSAAAGELQQPPMPAGARRRRRQPVQTGRRARSRSRHGQGRAQGDARGWCAAVKGADAPDLATSSNHRHATNCVVLSASAS